MLGRSNQIWRLKMSPDKQVTYVAEEVIEIRYKPSGSFINCSGQVADYIESKGLFQHWEIDQNTVIFKDSDTEPKQLSAFVSFKNAGFVSFDAPTANFFNDKASAFWKALESNSSFKIPKIQRLGLRNRCFVKSNLSFEILEKKLFDALFSTDISRNIGGVRKDLQVIFDLTEGENKIRLIIGPLKSNEAKLHFRFQSEHFTNTGLFVDIDIYKEYEGKSADVVPFIREASKAAWNKICIVAGLVGE
jgi:hypothetical protein